MGIEFDFTNEMKILSKSLLEQREVILKKWVEDHPGQRGIIVKKPIEIGLLQQEGITHNNYSMDFCILTEEEYNYLFDLFRSGSNGH